MVKHFIIAWTLFNVIGKVDPRTLVEYAGKISWSSSAPAFTARPPVVFQGAPLPQHMKASFLHASHFGMPNYFCL